MTELIRHYFPEATPRQIEQFARLEPLYVHWNQQINVISRKDIAFFYEHHVLHSLAIAKVLSFTPDTTVLDVGTGGGFPGVPLAIMFPEAHFTLVDSVGKKLKVVDSIITEIGLTNVSVINDRVENIDGTYDFVVSRAVTRLNDMWAWVHNKISAQSHNALRNGMLYLKGGNISAEIPNAVICRRFEIADMFSQPFFENKSVIYITDIIESNI